MFHTRFGEDFLSLVEGVFHYILTHGPPLAEHTRRLFPEKLIAAKAQFREWLKLTVCRPSNSSSHCKKRASWFLKKNGDWLSCSDFHRLNAFAEPAQFTVPHFHDF